MSVRGKIYWFVCVAANSVGYIAVKQKLNKRKVRVLLYHRIGAKKDFLERAKPELNVSKESFEKQLRFLKEKYNVISFKELISGNVPENSVIITFDDGFRDNYENAFPLLKKYSLKAAIFPISSVIDGKAFADDHFSYSKVKDKKAAAGMYLSWKQLREMSAAGIEIGAHTVKHRMLGNLDESAAGKEIADSKKEIENKSGKKVSVFAYPFYGEKSFNQKVKNLVKKADFRAAVTTVYGLNDSETDLFELRRIAAREQGMAVFKAQLEGFLGFLRD